MQNNRKNALVSSCHEVIFDTCAHEVDIFSWTETLFGQTLLIAE